MALIHNKYHQEIYNLFIKHRDLKNGFATAQKSFSLLVSMHIFMINYEILGPVSERRKTFDSLLANHFSKRLTLRSKL